MKKNKKEKKNWLWILAPQQVLRTGFMSVSGTKDPHTPFLLSQDKGL